jgi:hypothetical protein
MREDNKIKAIFNFSDKNLETIDQGKKHKMNWKWVDNTGCSLDTLPSTFSVSSIKNTAVEERRVGKCFASHWVLSETCQQQQQQQQQQDTYNYSRISNSSTNGTTRSQIIPSGKQDLELYKQMYIMLVGHNEYSQTEDRYRLSLKSPRTSIPIQELLN